MLISCLCFPDITAKEFIELRGRQQSRYDLLLDFLSEMLSVPPDDVNIFSLIDVKDRMLDVRFAVHVGPSFLQPEKMHGYLAAHKQKVGWVLLELPPPLVKMTWLTFRKSFTIHLLSDQAAICSTFHITWRLRIHSFFFLEQLASFVEWVQSEKWCPLVIILAPSPFCSRKSKNTFCESLTAKTMRRPFRAVNVTWESVLHWICF